jgi:hypothetical protein
MAFNYDEFGNVIGEYESEEERRKRLEDAAKAADTTVATEQKVVTYQNGSQTVETKKEIPPSAAQVNAEVVANARSMAPPQAPQAAQPQPAPQLQFDRNAYNTSIAQAESGNRPDIGFHDRTKSTAFGLFGITAPAYADARKRDPSLPEDITQATAEQQSKAQNILTDNNAKFLQQRGVEPTPGVLSAAHFTGANGLHKFLTQKDDQGRPYISPQAQAANGGYDKTRAIIEGRLNGQAVPSSGAVQRPPQAQPQEGVAVATGQGVQGTPTVMGPVSPQAVQQQAQNEMQGMQQFAQPAQPAPISPYSLDTGATGMGIRAPGIAAGQPVAQPTTNYQNLFQENQNNVEGLSRLINSDAPDYLKRRAADTRYELVNNTYMEEKAKAKIPNLTSNEVAKALSTTPRDAEGSWLKFLLMGFISPELAGAEAIKLNLGPTRWSTTTITDDAGNEINVEVQTRADGKLLSGNIAGTGEKLSAEQLQKAVRGGALGKGATVSAEVYVDQKTGKRYRSGTDSSGRSAYVSVAGGPAFKGNEKDLVPQSIGTAAAKAEATNAVELRYTGPKAYTKAGAEFAGKFNRENNTNIGYATETPGAPLVDLNTGKEIIPDSKGNITATKTGGGTVTQAAPAGAPATAAPAAASNLPLDKLPKAPTMAPGESPAAFSARTKAWAETYGKQYEAKEKNVKAAKDLLPFIGQMRDLIDKSTSSGIGSIFDSVGNFVGYSTSGANAIAAITPLSSKVLMGVERFEGPQSELDVKTYKEAAGRLSDPTIPAAQKQAAFNTIIDIMKRNAPDLDWNSVSIGQPAVSESRRRADEIIKGK